MSGLRLSVAAKFTAGKCRFLWMRCDVRVLVGWKGDGGEQLVENIGSKQVNTGLQPFTENLLTSLTIRHTISDVMGAKERKQAVSHQDVTRLQCRRTIGGRANFRDLLIKE